MRIALKALKRATASTGTRGLKMISTKTLAARLAGGDDYIRTKRGRVRGLALRTDLNPEAPEVIVVGMGPRVRAVSGRVELGCSVPNGLKV